VEQSVLLEPVRSGIGRKLIWASLGTVVTLTVLGQLFFLFHVAATGALTDASVVSRHGPFAHRVEVALLGALGKSDRGVRRFRVSSIQPSRSHPALKNIQITWALNKGLGAGTIGNGGMLDAYGILRSLFTSGLPIASVKLAGTYPTSQSKRDTTVMRLSMSRQVARSITQAGWDTMDPQTMWPLITRQYVAPGFQPLPGY
jgi:hypothetical protein